MASGTPGGNWKSTGGNKPPSGGGGGGSRRPWQPGGPGKKPPGGRKSRFGRFLLAGLATGLLIALIIWVLPWIRPPKYPILVVVGPNPGGTLAVPENSAGANSAAALAKWAGEDGGENRPRLAAPAHETTDKDSWKSKLDPKAKSVVVYFTAHGGADPTGPFLWFVPPDATAPTDEHKLRVRDILARLEELPRDQPKLLIFDPARFPAGWAHGMIFNDFARALKELEPDIAKVPGLVVVCSSDEDQRAWASEERRSSVFGHYLLEGLKGAAGKDPGERITAASLFDYVRTETSRWALANRDEKQTPILLPAADGRQRAEQIDLSAVPADGYKAPSNPDPPGKMPDDLEAAWANAARLSGLVPPPDTVDPGRWREYLDLLVRWERLVRQGEDPEAVRAKVISLGAQLDPAAGIEPPCLAVAIPAGRALGFRPAPRDATPFNTLWTTPQTARGDEWLKLLGPGRPNQTARRVAVADLAIDKVIADGLTKGTLQTADEVLGTVDGPEVGTAEGHFLRMLARHLDDTRPDAKRLRAAVALRKYAEEVAWVGGAGEKQHPHAEQVFRWTQAAVDRGDELRRPGEDLLFGTDAKRWQEADEVHFAEANKHYADAFATAGTVTAALNTRDKVLSRLPYYARWLGSYRGKIPAAEVDQLLGKVETAARGAHKLATRTADVPASPTELAARLAELKEVTAQVNADFDAVVKAFNTEAGSLGNTVHPSNWHALDGVLSVPFITKDRAKLLGYLREVSFALADPRSEQPGGAAAPPLPAQAQAQRQARMALAILGDDAPALRALVATPKPGVWWESYREAGDEIGKRFRGLPGECREAAGKAAAVPQFRDAGAHLDRAAYRARLVDPAAPLAANEKPVAAATDFWRHYFLIWQARRAVADGWANVDSTPGDPKWYCRDSARLSLDTARPLARGTDPNMAPQEIDRRLADLNEVAKLNPVMLTLDVPKKPLAICDEPTWDFQFTLTRGTTERVGFPVYWINAKELPAKFGRPDPGKVGRQVEPRMGKEAVVTEPFRFTVPARPTGDAGELVTTVLYRGHRYAKPTPLLPAGAATRDIVYNPPTGKAAFYVVADPSSVAGAVTILLDLSYSMKFTLAGKEPKQGEKSRLEETFDAIEALLEPDGMPAGTRLTVAVFWGDEVKDYVEPVPELTKVVLTGNAVQRNQLMKTVRQITYKKGGNTPLAKAMARILSKDEGPKFWPAQFAGVRTLIVLTDGADNWDKKQAGDVTLRALLTSPEDTALHLLFFALSGEERAALEQFQILKHKPAYQGTGRTPAEVYELKDAAGLIDRMKHAMRPRVRYQQDAMVQDRKAGRLTVTLPNDTGYEASPLLPAGNYELRGLRNPQSLRLEPGDRVTLRGRQRGDKFDLFVPPVAYESAGARTRGWPRGESAAVRMTVPQLEAINRVRTVDLNMVVTLEAAEDPQLGAELRIARPKTAWFELEYAAKKPADPAAANRTLRIENHPELVAPAWDLGITDWDRATGARPPLVTGYWIASYPDPAGKVRVDLRHPEEAARQVPQVTVDGRAVDVISVSIEDVKPGDPDLRKPGPYLTVRLGSVDPTKPVFVRPGGLKQDYQPYTLHERHQYYDAVGRYTARFGPIDEEDKKHPVVLEIHSVTQLKAQADRTGYTVQTDCTINGKLENGNRSDRVRIVPGKE